MEAATAGHVQRARHFTLQHRLAPAPLRHEPRDRAQEALGIGVARRVEDLPAGADLDDLAEVHYRDAIRHVPHHRQLVRDEQHGQPELVAQVLQQVQDLRLDRNVERRHRLIQHQEARPHGECPREADPLALPAAEGAGAARGVLGGEPDDAQQPSHLGLDLIVGADGVEAQDLGQRAADGEAWIERGIRILEDHLHVPAKRLQLARAERSEVLAHEPDAPAGRSIQPQQRASERRLAAAALADQTERLVPPDGEADTVHCADHGPRPPPDDIGEAAPRGERHREVLDLDQHLLGSAGERRISQAGW